MAETVAADEQVSLEYPPAFLKNGVCVARLEADCISAEKWVRAIASRAHASVNLHYSGGVVIVLHTGREASRARVRQAIRDLAAKLEGKILAIPEP